MTFRFADPWWFGLLVPVAILALWVARRRARSLARVVLPETSVAVSLGRSTWTRLEPALPWLRAATLVLVIFALARPQSGSTRESVTSRGVDVVVALDISGSMRALDFQPLNRLEVARRTLAEFVDRRPGDRIGLVAFGSYAATRCPLTLDHDLLRSLLAEIDFAPDDEGGTAIGMGLATAVQRLRGSTAKSRIVVLLTDGRNNRGQIGPGAAAEAAKALGVRVYTIGVGTEGEVPVPVQTAAGERYVMQRQDLDEELLKEIAATTDGRYFRATNPDALRETLGVIDKLETTDIESRVRVLYAERFGLLLIPALGLLLVERALVATRLRRIP